MTKGSLFGGQSSHTSSQNLEVWDKVGKVLVDLEKANKVATKMSEKVPENPENPLLAELRAKFVRVIESSVLLEAELAYVAKARKGRAGEKNHFHAAAAENAKRLRCKSTRSTPWPNQ